MARASLLLALVACSGAPTRTQQAVDIRANVDAFEEVCSFEGSFHGTLRFGGVDERVDAAAADARLFSSHLDVHVSGAGWHLYGRSNLQTDHVLRLQEATWFGEGVAVDRGQHVDVRGGETGRVFVRPHPSALANVVLRRPVGRWASLGRLTTRVWMPLSFPAGSTPATLSSLSLFHTRQTRNPSLRSFLIPMKRRSLRRVCSLKFGSATGSGCALRCHASERTPRKAELFSSVG